MAGTEKRIIEFVCDIPAGYTDITSTYNDGLDYVRIIATGKDKKPICKDISSSKETEWKEMNG